MMWGVGYPPSHRTYLHIAEPPLEVPHKSLDINILYIRGREPEIRTKILVLRRKIGILLAFSSYNNTLASKS